MKSLGAVVVGVSCLAAMGHAAPPDDALRPDAVIDQVRNATAALSLRFSRPRKGSCEPQPPRKREFCAQLFYNIDLSRLSSAERAVFISTVWKIYSDPVLGPQFGSRLAAIEDSGRTDKIIINPIRQNNYRSFVAAPGIIQIDFNLSPDLPKSMLPGSLQILLMHEFSHVWKMLGLDPDHLKLALPEFGGAKHLGGSRCAVIRREEEPLWGERLSIDLQKLRAVIDENGLMLLLTYDALDKLGWGGLFLPRGK